MADAGWYATWSQISSDISFIVEKSDNQMLSKLNILL
jgi:hypothetical protein